MLMENPIQPGSQVTLYYTLSLADGTVVDSTRAGEPASYAVGNGELLVFLEQRLLGLKSGERRHFEIGAGETQMPAGAAAVLSLPRCDFPADMALAPGQVIGFETPNDQEVPGLILNVTETEVQVDFSHPLAGRDLIFDVEILAVEPG
jgi:FKBP-type peptidyl-prolyl cis-trans isomerase SlpA